MEILRLLDQHPCVADYELEESRSWEAGKYYSVSIQIVDGSVLFAREYVGKDERSYSYHWQDRKGNVIRRWDNAPHHKNLKTYPHHQHSEQEVSACWPPNLQEVLDVIEAHLNNTGQDHLARGI